MLCVMVCRWFGPAQWTADPSVWSTCRASRSTALRSDALLMFWNGLEGFLMKLSSDSLCFSFLWKCLSCQSRTCAVVKMLKGCVISVCKYRHTCARVCFTAHSSIWIFLQLFLSLAGTRLKKPRECKRKELMPNRNATFENVCIIDSVIVLFKVIVCGYVRVL